MCLDCAVLRTQMEALEAELAGAVEGYEIESSNRRKAEREAHRLKRELNGSTTKESQRVIEVCDYHNELWHQVFPRAKGLTYPMDGKNAAAVRKVLRWGFKVEAIKHILDGAFASEFHRKKPAYLILSSVLGDENKIRNHLEHFQETRAKALLDEGLRLVSESLNVAIQEPIDRVLMALEAQDIPWRASRWGDEDFDPHLWHASCPVCKGPLRVSTCAKDWAHPVCASCPTEAVLGALWLEPADLARNFIPEVPVAA